MKILSVYQAHTKDAEGKLPPCDYISQGVRPDHLSLFEAASDLLAALEEASGYLDMDSPLGSRVRRAIAKAKGK